MSEQKTLLITGGTGKIGSILVSYFGQLGYKVFFTSRNPTHIQKLEKLHFPKKYFIKGIEINHYDSDSTQKLIALFHQQAIYPNVLINNVRNRDFLKIADTGLPAESDWVGEFKLAVITASELTMQLLNQPHSQLNNIINISSIYGIVPPNLNLYSTEKEIVPLHYGVAKAAQNHLTKELAVRLAKRNVRVNSVSFGGIEGRVNNEFISRYAAFCPQGRMLQEKDITGPVEFLLSEASSGTTGHNLIVDGGWTVW